MSKQFFVIRATNDPLPFENIAKTYEAVSGPFDDFESADSKRTELMFADDAPPLDFEVAYEEGESWVIVDPTQEQAVKAIEDHFNEKLGF